ncbi:MAG: ribbon-helix-helix domain-containing protein [Desulfobulbus sp.]|nr:ribbon-helix-helix domain-containing protein [Desulfobulbus sp.]
MKTSRGNKVRCSVRLAPDLDEALEKLQRQRRGVSRTDIIEAAVREFLFPKASDKKEAILGRSLDRIERRVKAIERNEEIIGETLSLFIRAWLTNTLELPDDQKSSAEKAGGRRYRKFLEALASRLQSGRSLFDDLPEDVFFKPTDFFQAKEGEGNDDDAD